MKWVWIILILLLLFVLMLCRIYYLVVPSSQNPQECLKKIAETHCSKLGSGLYFFQYDRIFGSQNFFTCMNFKIKYESEIRHFSEQELIGCKV